VRVRLRPVTPRHKVSLQDRDARPPKGAPSGDELKDKTGEERERIRDSQRVLYADGRFGLLVVLQGLDTSGKDGTIRNVFEGVNPQGLEVTSFKSPSETEKQHDYLWRIHQRVPARGMIGIFNRSHYEDVIVPRVRGSMTKSGSTARFREINDFERTLTDNGIEILKFFLHISRKEQKERLEKRLTNPEKNWKFRAGDLAERAQWTDYMAAYRDLLRGCSTKWAPWYVVPADSKKLRNWLIARTIADKLAALKLRYPRASAEVRALEVV
jgi:PPK2 family polyphosphate:nucleotide phosphotransferase